MGFIEGNWGNGVTERSQIPLEEGQQIRICSDQIGFISRAKHIIFTWNLGRMISIMNKSNIQNFIIRFNLEGREMIIWNFNGRKWMYISKFYYTPHSWLNFLLIFCGNDILIIKLHEKILLFSPRNWPHWGKSV